MGRTFTIPNQLRTDPAVVAKITAAVSRRGEFESDRGWLIDRVADLVRTAGCEADRRKAGAILEGLILREQERQAERTLDAIERITDGSEEETEPAGDEVVDCKDVIGSCLRPECPTCGTGRERQP